MTFHFCRDTMEDHCADPLAWVRRHEARNARRVLLTVLLSLALAWGLVEALMRSPAEWWSW